MQVLETLVAWAKDETTKWCSSETRAVKAAGRPQSQAETAPVGHTGVLPEAAETLLFWEPSKPPLNFTISKECVGIVEWLGLKINRAESWQGQTQMLDYASGGGGGGGRGGPLSGSDALSCC